VLLTDKLKCAVHKETWYTGSQSSFTRTRRASTWAVGAGLQAGSGNIGAPDLENQLEMRGARRISSGPPLFSVPQGQSVPQWSPQDDGISPTTLAPSTHTIFSAGKSDLPDIPEMAGARGIELSSPDVVSEPRRTETLPAGEENPGQEFRPKFLHEMRNPSRRKFTVANQLRATIFNSWINILLIAAPVGIALHFVNVSQVAIFVVNFVAIIPLAAMLGYATEEIAIRASDTAGSLLNATFGFVNAAVSTRSC
jgi:hypothetical protein